MNDTKEIRLKEARIEMARAGGYARASALSPERRREIARAAAVKRWEQARCRSRPEK